MRVAEVLVDGLDRVQEAVEQAARDLSPEQLATRLDPGANPVGWLLWHLTRVQDDHVADVAATEQVWTADGWTARLALPYPTRDTGYGHSSGQVGQFPALRAGLLTGYHRAVHASSSAYVAGLSETDLDRVVDEAWDPPVTLGVRLVSVLSDDLQHAGQAAYVRGLLLRRQVSRAPR